MCYIVLSSPWLQFQVDHIPEQVSMRELLRKWRKCLFRPSLQCFGALNMINAYYTVRTKKRMTHSYHVHFHL